MKVNMSSADRIIRVIIAVIFASLYFTGTVPGTLGLALTIVAVVFLLTSSLVFVRYIPSSVCVQRKMLSIVIACVY